MTITLANMEYTLKLLNDNEKKEYISLSKKVFNQIKIDKESNDLALALSENGTLAYLCLYQDNHNAFCSPYEALKKLSINELCCVSKAYFILTKGGFDHVSTIKEQHK